METMQVFWLIALVATGIFLVQFLISVFFGDIDVDFDGDANVDADMGSLVSFKGLSHFGMGFGWTMVLYGEPSTRNYIIAIVIGLIFMLVLWRLYILAYRLQKVRHPEKADALVGRFGNVYTNMGDGRYVIQIPCDGSLREIDVISESGCLTYRTGERVSISKFDDNKYYIK
ncbi:MAG: hypothetical protein ACI4TW_03900 [Prevotella sp.]